MHVNWSISQWILCEQIKQLSSTLLFRTVLVNGFCNPAEDQEDSGEFVSEQIKDKEQLLGLKDDKDEETEQTDESNGIEMSNDFA